MLVSDEGITIDFTKGEVLGSTIGLDDGVTLGLDNRITLGLDDGSQLVSSYRSFDGSNDGKPVGSLLGF